MPNLDIRRVPSPVWIWNQIYKHGFEFGSTMVLAWITPIIQFIDALVARHLLYHLDDSESILRHVSPCKDLSSTCECGCNYLSKWKKKKKKGHINTHQYEPYSRVCNVDTLEQFFAHLFGGQQPIVKLDKLWV